MADFSILSKDVECVLETPAQAFLRTLSTQPGVHEFTRKMLVNSGDDRFLHRFNHDYYVSSKFQNAKFAMPLKHALKGKGEYFLTYEPTPHLPMSLIIDDKTFSVADVIRIAINLTKCVTLLHEAGAIHCHLNPDSVLIDESTLEIKLWDFRYAQLTPPYNPVRALPKRNRRNFVFNSPEQNGVLGQKIDYRADQYAIGAILYKLTTGYEPYVADSAYDLLTAQICKSPLPPRELNDTIPEALSVLIHKLLSKDPELRYAHTHALIRDLEDFFIEWQAHRNIRNAHPGAHDVPLLSTLNLKLATPELSTITLNNVWQRIREGHSELIVIEGPNGSGKRELADSLKSHVLERQGFYLSGSFLALARQETYSAFIQILRDLLGWLSLLDESDRSTYQAMARKAVGSNGKALIDMVPELEAFLGTQPNLPDLPATEAQDRFHMVVQKFLAVFAKRTHPLVIVFRNIQNSDQGSLALLRTLLSANIQYLMVICTINNDNAMSAIAANHAIDGVRRLGITVTDLKIDALNQKSTDQILSKNLRTHSQPNVATLIWKHTKGDLHHVSQLMQSMINIARAIKKDDKNNRSWEHIAEQVIEKFGKKPEAALAIHTERDELLETTAVLGAEFIAGSLAVCTGMSIESIAIALDKFAKIGVLEVISGDEVANNRRGLFAYWQEIAEAPEASRIYRWADEKHRLTLCSWVSADEAARIHGKLGLYYLKAFDEERISRHLFELVQHLNRGESVLDQSQKILLAKLNFEAGKQAKSSTAHSLARAYFADGARILPESSWQHDFELAFSLNLELAESDYLCADHVSSENILLALRKRAEQSIHVVQVIYLTVNLYMHSGRAAEAVALGVEGLQIMGISIPKDRKVLEDNVGRHVGLMYERLKKISDDKILNSPPMTDESSLATSRLISVLLAPAFQSDHVKWSFFILQAMELSLKHGNSATSPFVYMSFAKIVGSKLRDYPSGARLSNLALTLKEKYLNFRILGELEFVCGGFISHWTDNIQSSIQHLNRSFEAALASSDLVFIAVSLTYMMRARLISGTKLRDIHHEWKKHYGIMKDLNYPDAMHAYTIPEQVVRCLAGETKSITSLSDESFDEDALAAQLNNSNVKQPLTFYNTVKIQLYFLAEEFETAYAFSEEAEKYLSAAFAQLTIPEHFFYQSLIISELLTHMDDPQQDCRWDKLVYSLKEFERYAASCPENFEHKFLLLQAEQQRLLKNDLLAMKFYDLAIASAADAGYIQSEAIAAELAGRFYSARGQNFAARTYLARAHHSYLNWGALTKAHQLEEKFSALISGDAADNHLRIDHQLKIEKSHELVITPDSQIDLGQVLSAIHRIAENIVVEPLVTTLLDIVAVNTSATEIFLIVDKENSLCILGRHIDGKTEYIEEDMPLDQSKQLCSAVVLGAAKSKHHLLLNNATRDGAYAADPFFKRRKQDAVLCFPVIYQSQLSCVLYLSLASKNGAFHSGHVEFLRFISSQIGVSLQNTKLYDEVNSTLTNLRNSTRQLGEYSATLERKVESRSLELQSKRETLRQALRQIQERQHQLIIQEKLASVGTLTAAIAHEIRNPLNFINNFATLCGDLADDMVDELKEFSAEIDDDLQESIDAFMWDFKANILKIASHGQTAERIVQNMLKHSRAAEGEWSEIDINDLIEEYITLTSHSTRANEPNLHLEFDSQLDPKKCVARVKPQDLSRVFVNVLNNAIAALVQKLEMIGEDFSPLISVSTEAHSDRVIILIRDNGVGMDEDTLNKAFQPFFSTRPEGDGVGLGLSIAHDVIVDEHRGSIALNSIQGEFTECRIELPL